MKQVCVITWAPLLWSLVCSVQAETCITEDKQLLWGDLHVHTSYSMDAYVWNNTVVPADAYAFAKGEAIERHGGGTIQLERPLDFAAVTDHAEYFGAIYDCRVADVGTSYCAELDDAAREESRRGFYDYFLPALLRGDRLCQSGEPGSASCVHAEKQLWQQVQDSANDANEPCEFTAFIANEWTASPDNMHWHRNLIYANEFVPPRAINSFDEPNQVALWKALDERCAQVEGCEVLAIPHNSNLSMGGTFATNGHGLAEFSLRAQFEKLVEIHQHKGASECAPQSIYTDEACGFEHMLAIPILRDLQNNPRPLTDDERQVIASGYVRDTLARGLQLKSETGVNPFLYGFIGSTDTHSGRPGEVDEMSWQGAVGSFDLDPERRLTFEHYNPGGLVAAWAHGNTRDEVFSALARREVYATSGPRIRMKFGAAAAASCEEVGGLVPMGSTYAGETPTFVVQAEQDRVALSRIDIVKLSLVDGEVRQTIHSFQAPPMGKAQWCVAWTDEAHESDDLSLWYTRVLQQATSRWDRKTLVHERAWSSPIWSVAASK